MLWSSFYRRHNDWALQVGSDYLEAAVIILSKVTWSTTKTNRMTHWVTEHQWKPATKPDTLASENTAFSAGRQLVVSEVHEPTRPSKFDMDIQKKLDVL